MNAAPVIPPALRERQQAGSDPGGSAWVSANAGSGKTYVLTRRVLRLLLEGAPPSQILGLTFTKAAAANMAHRLFKTLAEWARLDDEGLAEKIRDLRDGNVSRDDLRSARLLFARAIETPGGLKIQTLHAFCERLLQLFPFEANVPAHFRVLDEHDAKVLMREARNQSLIALRASVTGAAALELAAREAGAARFDDLLAEAQGFADVFAAFEEPASFSEALRDRLGLPPGVTTARIEEEMLGGDAGRARREAWARALDRGSKSDRKMAICLRAVEDGDRSNRAEALLEVFFTDDGAGDRRGTAERPLVTKCIVDCAPTLLAELLTEQDRLVHLRERRRAAQALERSAALFAVAKTALAAYERAKAVRGQLDFADQIARALALVTRSSAAWVMRKLDYSVDHLLVDEAQDTSAAQWGVLEALTAEFFAGEGARARGRTVFAVGDEKQSIFSFQGAAPEQFAEMRRRFAKRSREAALPFENVQLDFSFRSAPAILHAVDKTFHSDEARRGLTAENEPPPAHEAVKSALKGVVELWPTMPAVTPATRADWRMPLDAISPDAPAVALAKQIAETIASWVSPASPERLADPDGSPRPIRAGDVMILVRTRSAFFEAMIRALKDKGVEVEGADRLKLREHIAVMDLVAAGRAALLPDDDLTLACVLKSPLMGLDEDDIFAVASGRTGPLWRALAASEAKPAQEAYRRLSLWRERAKTLPPYDFYARLLGEDGGRKALLARLGQDAKEPIDEFLALALAREQRQAPSMQAFLAEIEANDGGVKRDMETDAKGVRVLTVHASKGLEAPIVFVPDACDAPDGRRDPKLFRLAPAQPGSAPLFIWRGKAGDDCAVGSEARLARRAAEQGEHRRLLYVAMTRAAQRLIVAGYETSRKRKPDCWYSFVERGLRDIAKPAPAPWDPKATILRYGEGLRADNDRAEKQFEPRERFPSWLIAPAAQESERPALHPSRIGFRRLGSEERISAGRLGHALLQSLPRLPSEQRAAGARAYLEAHGAALAPPMRVDLATKVLRVMEAPETRDLFGPNSRGEVSLVGALRREARADLPYRGRLDRLLVADDCVTIADFKLGAAPARHAPAHVAQLAVYREALRPLYPGLILRAALVYLDGPTLAIISDRELDEALAGSAFSRLFVRIELSPSNL
ncbi:MAG TPA: double-strand break repair helicase AddA [Roseiarcus sp.]|nr:double-strand break repair helicase AddA [Roseiarcus sp.]